jgi:hypothetical protein
MGLGQCPEPDQQNRQREQRDRQLQRRQRFETAVADPTDVSERLKFRFPGLRPAGCFFNLRHGQSVVSGV